MAARWLHGAVLGDWNGLGAIECSFYDMWPGECDSKGNERERKCCFSSHSFTIITEMTTRQLNVSCSPLVLSCPFVELIATEMKLDGGGHCFFSLSDLFGRKMKKKKIGTPWGGERTPFSFRTVVDLEKINLAESGEKMEALCFCCVASATRETFASSCCARLFGVLFIF